MTNCYRILGIKDFALEADIKTAYRKLSKKFHPDVNEGDKFFEERFIELQQAYEILTDSHKKRIHDSQLINKVSDEGNFNFKKRDETRTAGENNGGNNKNSKTTHTANDTHQPDNHAEPKLDLPLIIIITLISGILIFMSTLTKTKNIAEADSMNYSNIQSTANYSAYDSQSSSAYVDSFVGQDSTPVVPIDDELSPSFSNVKTYFTLGSTKSEVLAIQGNPTGINNYEGTDIEIWNYELSSVTFEHGRVNEYRNTSRNLQISLNISEPSSIQIDYFTLGSTKDEVLQVQGNPTGISKYGSVRKEIWNYELSSVTFDRERVSEYRNTSRNLQVRL